MHSSTQKKIEGCEKSKYQSQKRVRRKALDNLYKQKITSQVDSPVLSIPPAKNVSPKCTQHVKIYGFIIKISSAPINLFPRVLWDLARIWSLKISTSFQKKFILVFFFLWQILWNTFVDHVDHKWCLSHSTRAGTSCPINLVIWNILS